MPKTPLQAAAAKADDAAKVKKARGLFASALALLGVGGDDGATAKPEGRMSKRTETTKHTIVEEDDGDGEEAEYDSESEEEAEDSATDMTGSEAEEEESDSGAEEEEEDSDGGEEEEERSESEEEEEKALARAVTKAMHSDAVKQAFLAAVPKRFRAAAALRAPNRIAREMMRATGAKTIDGAMTSLSRSRKTAAKGDAKVIKAQAELAARVERVESANRAQRVDTMVAAAKAAGKAPTKALRAQLREHGNAHGTKALANLIASLPVVAPTKAKIASADGAGNVVGAPSKDVQAMEKAMFAHITDDKERAAAIAEYRAKLAERTNAAGGDA